MGKFRFLDLVKPFQYAIPEIENPISKAHLSFDDKIFYSIGISIFFVFSQLPLYGVTSIGPDPFYQFRPLFASAKGTLDEFGLIAVVTSGFFWQLLSGFRFISVNFNSKADRGFFQTLQKITTIGLAGVYAFALVFLTDYYNPTSQFSKAITYNGGATEEIISNIGTSSTLGAKFLIWSQLFVYNVILTYVVEILDKDYGFTSGAMFLIGINASVELVSGLFDITSINHGKNHYEYRGVLIQLFVVLKNSFSRGTGFFKDIVHVYNRSNLVNLQQVLFAVISFFFVFYLQAFHQAVAIKSKQVKTQAQNYPIKLFYNGALPIIFAYGVFFNIKLVSYFFYKFTNTTTIGQSLIKVVLSYFESSSIANYIIHDILIGEFTNDVTSTKSYQVSGITSFFQSPLSFTNAIFHPLNTLIYVTTSFGLIMFFATNWTKMSGGAGKDIANMFTQQNLTILGKRDANVAHYFNKIISSASISGGLILSALSIGYDLFGGLGFPNAVVASVLIVFGFLENFYTELQQSGGSSMFTNALGQPGSLFG